MTSRKKAKSGIIYIYMPHQDEVLPNLSHDDKVCILNNLDGIEKDIARIRRILHGEAP